MRFRDQDTGRYVSLEVALSNPDVVIPLGADGRTSSEATMEWGRLLAEILQPVPGDVDVSEEDVSEEGEYDLGEAEISA